MSSITTNREQRLAAMLAAREAAPAWETLIVSLAEIRPDDFLVRVPSQRGVRGVRVEALVQGVETTSSEWGVRPGSRRRLRPVESVRVELVDLRLAAVSYPASFRAVIRRVAR